ncbi:MAG TPA: protein kinase [Terriglobia bacterium]|nr:protein kinase [Terriglobia bacterium]
MTPERWQQITDLFEAALERERGERAAFLAQTCGQDKELCFQVESLIREHEQAGSFMASPVLGGTEASAERAASGAASMAGETLLHYRILEKIDEGGMGKVYLAEDTTLGRRAAIKVLHDLFIRDPERLGRFRREAQALASLNHPHIVTIYEINRAEGLDFIAMEYVEGRTLEELIPRKGMGLKKALPIAIQVADALAVAHGAGIVHRDLKPGNVMVAESGQVKVLDFGLAKLTDKTIGPEQDEKTTLPGRNRSLTEEGLILGTVAYMSPEQAEGKKLDERTDIFSFGSVLYEMVTGRKAFDGDTNISTLGAILKQEPKPVSELSPDMPHDLEKVINRCLRKDPGRRFQDMEDLKVALEELKEESDSGKLAMTATTGPSTRRTWYWAGAMLTVVALAVAGWFLRETDRKPTPSPQVIPLTSYPGWEKSPSFSLDGNQVAFSWSGEKQDNTDIYIKLVGAPTPLRLTTDPASDDSPAFSPDGRSIGFIRRSGDHATFIIIPAIGGPERVVAEVPVPSLREFTPIFSWFPDSKWVVIDGLALLSTETGEMRTLTMPPTKESLDFSPAVSPDGHTIAFSHSTGLWLSEIYLLDLTDDLNPRGKPRRLTSLKGDSWGSAWTPGGREIIFSLDNGGRGTLWKVPASGASEPVKLPYGDGAAHWPAISRSGARLAYESWVRNSHIWRLPLSGAGVASGSAAPFLASTRWDSNAQYSPDGKRIAFESDRGGVWGIWMSDSEGSNTAELFVRTGTQSGTPSWSPDGEKIAFDSDMEGTRNIYVIRVSGGKPLRLTNDSAIDRAPSWSRDGRWIYFASNRSGRSEIWKVPSGGGEAIEVTRNGGMPAFEMPAFESPDGKSIYYIKGEGSLWKGSLWKMPVSGGEETQLIPSVAQRGFSLVNEGVYFIARPGAGGKGSIQFLSFATGRVSMVTRLSALPMHGLSVSPDSRNLLFSQFDEMGCTLMLVENFR